MGINDIITAISIKLNQVFGDDIRIYADDIPQGFKAPAFFILFLNLEQIQQIGNRWRINTLFNVQYFPQNGRAEASNMSLKVQQALKEITLLNGTTMLSTNGNTEIVDGNAHNFINFNFFLQEIEAKEFMWSLEQRSKTTRG
ncbi:MAG: hypothetical protein GX072_04480 [Lysinibacillus sp.]|nr:hypothetical protein [Lysinibacillus sp.]